MRISYHQDTDSLTLYLNDKAVDVSEEVANDTVLHFDIDGWLVAVEIYGYAKEKVDMSRLDLVACFGEVRHLEGP